MKKPELLVLIAIWEFLTAFFAFIGLAAIAVFAFPTILFLTDAPRIGGLFGLSVASLLLLGYIVLAVAGGLGLLSGKEWGRVLSMAHAGISLLWIPVGTIIGVLILVYLTRQDVRDYFVGTGASPG